PEEHLRVGGTGGGFSYFHFGNNCRRRENISTHMSNLIPSSPAPGGEFLLYQTENGRTRIQCRFEDETIWLTQAQIAELFQTTPQNVTLHLKAIFAEGELSEAATCKDYLQVRQEGARAVSRSLRHYRLEAILPDAGKVSREQADAMAEQEYDR